MATVEIPCCCEFQAGADQVRLTTQTNGDSVTMKGLNLTKDQAASLAYLINDTDNHLSIEIKKVT